MQKEVELKGKQSELQKHEFFKIQTKRVTKNCGLINPESFEESKIVARQGGNVAKVARLELEAKTGKKVVTKLNAKDLGLLKQ